MAVIGIFIILMLISNLIPAKKEMLDRIAFTITAVAFIFSVFFQAYQYKALQNSLQENYLRTVPHLAISPAQLRRDDHEILNIEMTLFNVGLGNLFVISSQIFWRVGTDSPEKVEVGVVENPNTDRYPLVIQAGERVLISFEIALAKAFGSEARQNAAARTARASEIVEARIEIYYRGAASEAAEPLIHHLHFADIRIADAVAPQKGSSAAVS